MWNAQAIKWGMEASIERIASIDDTGVVRRTANVGVDTANTGIARVNGANIVVITIGGVKWDEAATSEGIADLVSTKASIITDGEVVVAVTRIQVAIIVRTQISIITVLGSSFAESIGAIAYIGKAIKGRANHRCGVEAKIARKGSIYATSLSNNTGG